MLFSIFFNTKNSYLPQRSKFLWERHWWQLFCQCLTLTTIDYPKYHCIYRHKRDCHHKRLLKAGRLHVCKREKENKSHNHYFRNITKNHLFFHANKNAFRRSSNITFMPQLHHLLFHALWIIISSSSIFHKIPSISANQKNSIITDQIGR